MYKVFFSVIALVAGVILLSDPIVVPLLIKWTPLLALGFVDNILIGVASMSIGILLGVVLGSYQYHKNSVVSGSAIVTTQFFRNAPWIVLLFLCSYLIPYNINGFIISDYVKSILGFSLSMLANVSEITRGVLASIPKSQWDGGFSLGLKKWQVILLIILPQGIKRALPPLMNIYTVLVSSTVLASIVGVHEVLAITSDITAVDDHPAFFLPLYLYVMTWFFIFCYPISCWSKKLELQLTGAQSSIK